MRVLAPDRVTARGSTSVLDFNRASGWAVPAQPGETLGGLVFSALGSAPSPGDRIEIEGYELAVLACKGTWIQEVEVVRRADETAEDGVDEEV